MLGTSGKLNLMFRNPIRWKQGGSGSDADTAFRYYFAVDNLSDYEAATMAEEQALKKGYATSGGKDGPPNERIRIEGSLCNFGFGGISMARGYCWVSALS